MTDLPDGSVFARAARDQGARWSITEGRVNGKLYATGRVNVTADGPPECAREAAEALARSWQLLEPVLRAEWFLKLMERQGVPLAAAEEWARGARVTQDEAYLTWVWPR
jgi:hypothetical protein